MVYRVTFVCTGNICRSPMAEHIVRRRFADAGLDAEVDSSGTGGWHEGDPADSRTVAVLRRAGYTSAHRARQFLPAWFDRYDLVVALDRGHHRALRAMAATERDRAKVRLLREFDPDADSLDVPDPYYGGNAGFDLVRAQIEAAVPGLIAEIRAHRASDPLPG
ncbi:low molecular weight protein-tyrosine-phosphatase [Acrocarpospora phusangensis]|uniref:protein-tyrosine-phosphatase n=1 Tax=Acrocarpospora phusangensis TaxID=1070424 RepID=A0A919USM3_9ACTN|nr:low molecular weight protein-tyrosine-phosphatase [Acrocarpospora phusangensis]GIH26585.1 low molecular weight protein-tyrosine-phosphatase [Acrocarpospora phusangensis]